MAKEMTNDMFSDVISSIDTVTTSIEKVTSQKQTKIAKGEVGKLGTRYFTSAEAYEAIASKTIEITKTLSHGATYYQELMRNDLASFLSNVPAKIRDDRSEEGMVAYRVELEKARYGMYVAQYEEGLPAEDAMRTGKVQSLRKKATAGKDSAGKEVVVKGDIKFGSWIKTHRGWNVSTQLISELTKFGYNNVVTPKGVVPYKETQKWSVSEEGGVIKEAVAKEATPASDEANTEQSIVTLRKRLEKIDVLSGKGEQLLNQAMLMLSEVRTSQLAKAAADKAVK
jgi:hypothetical protein